MQNFWDVHGIWFIFFMFFFPRLTLIFSSVVTGGFFWWLGWLFTPRLLVAILATKAYANTNIILVVLAWIWALGGEKFEKKNIVINNYRRRYPRRENEVENRKDVIDV